MFIQESYKIMRKGDSIERYKKHDNVLKLHYIPDHICIDQNDPSIIRTSNLEFLKILLESKIFNVDTSQQFIWKNFITFDDIKKIVVNIRNWYQKDKLSDSDLHDDIFDHFNIVYPFTKKQEFISKNQHKFSNKKECSKFFNSRMNLFCIYVFLRRCAILHRDTGGEFRQPLDLILELFKNKKAVTDFEKKFLRAESCQFAGDFWGTGLHEWLTCEYTLVALKRTANLEPGIEPCIKPTQGIMRFKDGSSQEFIFSEFNWLDFQFLVRTATKHIIFSHNLNGHPGAVYEDVTPAKCRDNKGYGAKTEWSPIFHEEINKKFLASKKISKFMRGVYDIYENYILHDKTVNLNLTLETCYFADKTRTDKGDEVRQFQLNELKDSHEAILVWRRDIKIHNKLAKLKDQEEVTYQYRTGDTLPFHKTLKANPAIANKFANEL